MKNRILFLFLSLAFIILPVSAFTWGSTWGSLDQKKYKIKGSDGNRWASLLGRGKTVKGNEAPYKITFTFDDGPDHRTTPVLLDQLDKYEIKASFFVNGHRFHHRSAGAKENQSVLREIHRRGHFIGNHTFSHKDITTLDDNAWKQEVLQVEQQVRNITGRRPYLFRPPFGRGDGKTFLRLYQEGYTVVMWNMDPLDWKAKTAKQLLKRAKEIITDHPEGGVFLLHDTNRNTVEAFPLIIEWLAERNENLRAEGKKGLEIVGIEHFINH